MTLAVPSTQLDRRIGTTLERLAMPLQELPVGAQFFEYDTGVTYEVTVLPGGASPTDNTKVWSVIATAGASPTWGKYVVWGGPLPGPATLYATWTAAIAAAVADGAGPAKPTTVLGFPGTYTEDLTLQPGIHLAALGGGGGEQETPEVILVGTQTVADVAGTLTCDGLWFDSDANTPLTVGGASDIVLKLARCTVTASLISNATVPAIVVGNSGPGSALALDDCFVQGGMFPNLKRSPAATSTVAVAAAQTTFGGSTTMPVLELGTGTSDALARCDLTGAIVKASGELLLSRTRIDCDANPTVAGSPTIIPVLVEAPNGLTVDPAAVVAARKTVFQRPRAILAGAGPFTLDSTSDTVVASPGVDTTEQIALPDVTTLAEGDEWSIGVDGAGLGSAVVVLTTFGAQPFSDGALNQRLYEGGSIRLRVDRGSALWRIVGLDRGTPDVLALTVDPAAGSDATGDGTAAAPYQTVVHAFAIANRDRYVTSGSCTVVGAAVEDTGGQLLNIPGGVGPESNPFVLSGSYETAPGFAALYTTNAAGTGLDFGPPIVLTRAAIPATAAFAANGAVGFFIRFTSGPLSGVRSVVVASTATTVDFFGTFAVAPGAGNTFAIEQPAFELSSLAGQAGFQPGTGASIQINALRLNPSDAEQVSFIDVQAVLQGCRAGQIFMTRAVVALGTPAFADLTPLVAQFVNVFSGSTGSIAPTCRGDVSSTCALSVSLLFLGTSSTRTTASVLMTLTAMSGEFLYGGTSFVATTCVFQDAQVTASAATGVRLENIRVANTIAGVTSLLCDDGARATVTSVYGTTEATTFGMRCLRASRVTVTDPNTGTTISGGANLDCQIGVLAGAATTWALINGNAYANINDNAGAPAGGTGATVSK